MLTHPTLDRLKALRLDGMAEAFADLQAQDSAADLSHAEWLGLLVDREVASRETKRFEARMRSARLRHVGACPEDVDYRARRGLDKALFQSPSDNHHRQPKQRRDPTRKTEKHANPSGLKTGQGGSAPDKVVDALHSKPSRRTKKLRRACLRRHPRARPGQADRALVARVSRARKQSGGLFSRRTRASVSRAA